MYRGIKKSAIIVIEDALLEYGHLKQNDIFSTIKKSISGYEVAFLVDNARSISRNVDDIVSDNRIKHNDIIGFMETKIKPSGCICKITETLNLFNINFNSNENKFLSSAYRFVMMLQF